MTSRPRQRRRRGLFGLWFWLVLLVLIAGAWGWGWFRAAAFVDTQVDTFLARSQAAGRTIECPDRRYDGFPFSIRLSCSALSVDTSGRRVDAGAMQASWRVISPATVSTSLAGPLALDGEVAALATWDKLATALRFNLDGPYETTLHAEDFVVGKDRDDLPVSMQANMLDIAARRIAGDDKASPLDLKLTGSDVAVSGPDALDVPPFSVAADLRLDDGPDRLAPGFDYTPWLRKNGLSGELRNVEIAAVAGGSVNLSGPFKLAPDGLLSANLDIGARDFSAIAQFLSAFFRGDPDKLEQLQQAAALLTAAGLGGDGTKLKLTIRRGNVSAGFLPLGRIPPLF